MRWNGLFDDLEAHWADLGWQETVAEAAELTRAEWMALSLADRLRGAGLVATDSDLTWRVIGDDVLAIAERIAGDVDEGGGELSIRRPGLDDLVARLLERKT